MRNCLVVAGALALSFAAAGVHAQDADQIAAGEKVFRKCAACHAVGADAKNKVGPELADVIGRTAGTAPDFEYSPAMIAYGEAGNVWDAETLSAYLESPKTVVKGTKMAFAGLKKPEERASVIAYIESQQVAR
jgi:cytochrome c